MITHRCEKWKDVELAETIGTWGSYLQFCDIPMSLNGEVKRDFWITMDTTTDTFSVYEEEKCPFCGVELAGLLMDFRTEK